MFSTYRHLKLKALSASLRGAPIKCMTQYFIFYILKPQLVPHFHVPGSTNRKPRANLVCSNNCTSVSIRTIEYVFCLNKHQYLNLNLSDTYPIKRQNVRKRVDSHKNVRNVFRHTCSHIQGNLTLSLTFHIDSSLTAEI